MLGPERNVANRNRKKQTGGRGDRAQYDVEIHGGGGGRICNATPYAPLGNEA